jgi:caffeoyl-CoA O-methyltransferase
MFSEMTEQMLARMRDLEKMDAKDKASGKPAMQRLRQVPPQTGRFLALMASISPAGNYVEIGTSAGYSTMWLSLAARERNIIIKTFELMPEKIRLAGETFRQANIEQYVELIEGDALIHLPGVHDVAFCFLDTEKHLYEGCWNIIAEKMVRHGVLLADNAVSHALELETFLDTVDADTRFDSLIVPIGNGVLVCGRK